LLLVFVFFNIDNKSDINFGFTKIQNAPVYLTAFTSFVIGMAAALLSVFVFRRQRRKNPGGTNGGDKKRGGKSGAPESPNLPARTQGREKTGGYSETETEGGGFTDSGHYGID
jgi:uncharacterized membrane protein